MYCTVLYVTQHFVGYYTIFDEGVHHLEIDLLHRQIDEGYHPYQIRRCIDLHFPANFQNENYWKIRRRMNECLSTNE